MYVQPEDYPTANARNPGEHLAHRDLSHLHLGRPDWEPATPETLSGQNPWRPVYYHLVPVFRNRLPDSEQGMQPS